MSKSETVEMLEGLFTSPRAFTDQYIIDAAQAAIDEIERLSAENKEHEQLFSLQWEADMRAIKMWQEANPGNDLVWPDSAKLSVWLLEQMDAMKFELLETTMHVDALQGLLTESTPFIGYQAHVPDLLKRIDLKLEELSNSDTPETTSDSGAKSDEPQNPSDNHVSKTDGDLTVSNDKEPR